ncbi:hypothetical protein [Leptolyngbya sp. GGD]|uniref:hypothetical protein n=1 Tax=Leptolyngbya sp. GGD TaxID=2997907 RepID=UPI00227B9BDA|nr:hypothetical protein [Leptolyngbya sp. GGD]MCY6494074.1 hypothetical protein [Leptolyngbya sp. GGD]
MTIQRGIVAASFLAFACVLPVQASSALLTRGEVYKLTNQAQLLQRNRPARPARLSDVLVPQDAIKTATRSRAELLFNEGSLARIGSNAIFRFIPGMRGFQLRNGTALIMSPPTTVATRIETLDGSAIAELPPSAIDAPPTSEQYQTRSLAMVVHVDGANNKTQFFNLTNNPIKILDNKGNFIVINGGETVTVQNGVIGKINTFDLRKFYQTSSLSTGLAPAQESLIAQEPAKVQATLNLVRVATISALNLQARKLEGLCTLNARGGASTLSTNCITTDSDDPLRDFQDRRDVTTPRPERQPPVDVVVPLTPPPTTPPPTTPPPTTPATNPNSPTGVPVFVRPN